MESDESVTSRMKMGSVVSQRRAVLLRPGLYAGSARLGSRESSGPELGRGAGMRGSSAVGWELCCWIVVFGGAVVDDAWRTLVHLERVLDCCGLWRRAKHMGEASEGRVVRTVCRREGGRA